MWCHKSAFVWSYSIIVLFFIVWCHNSPFVWSCSIIVLFFSAVPLRFGSVRFGSADCLRGSFRSVSFQVYIDAIRTLHLSTCDELELGDHTKADIESLLDDLRSMLEGVGMLRELTRRYDTGSTGGQIDPPIVALSIVRLRCRGGFGERGNIEVGDTQHPRCYITCELPACTSQNTRWSSKETRRHSANVLEGGEHCLPPQNTQDHPWVWVP